MQIPALAGLILIFFSVILLIGLFLLKDRVKASFRDIPAFANFTKALGNAVENGSRIHFSLGSAGLSNSRTAASFASLSVLRQSAELSAASDKSPLATSGDATLTILSQDSLKIAHNIAGVDHRYEASSGRLAGLTPFSYAAGTVPTIYDEDISANMIAGSFGVEVGLLSDASERTRSFTLAATDSLPAQSVLYANANEVLIGEELFASGAYLDIGRTHLVSLYVQDILRWIIVATLLGGAAMKLLAGLL
ncbi:MAG: hypothetical protein HN392_01900 [Anaerolineae bacterium]|nr:hypothetical protein [Anaerolineae bacterium]MBT7075324.1 hypothetical protein [Anaerolineae bacterium]MBT7783917.1 hypothetical protein [Anaerolineae bacterium]